MEACELLNSPKEREKSEEAARAGVRKILDNWPMPTTIGKLVGIMEDAFKCGWVAGVKQACAYNPPEFQGEPTYYKGSLGTLVSVRLLEQVKERFACYQPGDRINLTVNPSIDPCTGEMCGGTVYVDNATFCGVRKDGSVVVVFPSGAFYTFPANRIPTVRK